jgi:hypothetical protein
VEHAAAIGSRNRAGVHLSVVYLLIKYSIYPFYRELASDLDARLRKLADSTSVEVYENGSRVATLGPMSWELRGAPAKPLLPLGSKQCQ